MSSDYAEKEREFLDTLEADTGRDLSGWMVAIAGSGLSHRDDIIDWLRRQRFTFDRASWLERIHNNGGRPIYAERPASKPQATEAGAATASRSDASLVPPAAIAATAHPAQQAPPVSKGDASGFDDLLAKGKAFRPLAQHVLKAIESAVPGTRVSIRGALIALGAPIEYAVLAVSARDVKLGLAMGDAANRDGLDAARIPGAGPAVTHMAVLTDVRRVDAALLERVAEAAARAAALSEPVRPPGQSSA